VGHGILSATGEQHALMWLGTASSVIDLHQYLQGLPQSFSFSQAGDIADNGQITGIAYNTTGQYYAVLWTPVPEPSDWLLAAVSLPMIIRSRGRNSY
jgi:hypothetical protein